MNKGSTFNAILHTISYICIGVAQKADKHLSFYLVLIYKLNSLLPSIIRKYRALQVINA